MTRKRKLAHASSSSCTDELLRPHIPNTHQEARNASEGRLAPVSDISGQLAETIHDARTVLALATTLVDSNIAGNKVNTAQNESQDYRLRDYHSDGDEAIDSVRGESSDGDNEDMSPSTGLHFEAMEEPDGNAFAQKDMALPRTWKRARETICDQILSKKSQPQIVLMTGTSNSGSWRFLQWIVTTLLSPPLEINLGPVAAVAVIDIDPLTFHFGLPGHVSLLVLPASYTDDINSTTQFAKYTIPVGSFGHNDSPATYTQAVQQLFSTFRTSYAHLPLLIQCPSLEKEVEVTVSTRNLMGLVSRYRPNHICCTAQQAAYAVEAFASLRHDLNGCTKLWELEAVTGYDSDVNLRSYFTLSAQNSGHGGSLVSQTIVNKPYAISYGTPASRVETTVAGVFIYGDLPPNHDSMVSRIIDHSLVSIYVQNEIRATSHLEIGENDRIPYFTSQNGGNPDANILLSGSAVGIAFVAGIDKSRQILYLETPCSVAMNLRAMRNSQVVLVHGIMDTPSWLLLSQPRAGEDPLYVAKARKGMQMIKSRRFKKK